MRLSFKSKLTLTLLLVVFIAGLALIYLVYFLAINNYLTQAERVMTAAGFFILLITSLAAGLIYWAVSRFLKPLLELQRLVKKVSQGNFKEKLEINSQDEIGQLGQALNELIDAIRLSRSETDRQLAEQNQELKLHRNNNNNHLNTLGLLQQLDDEKKAINSIASDLQKFKLAADNAFNHIVITDVDGRIIYANKSVERITGFQSEEIMGKKAGSQELWGGLMTNQFYEKFWQTIKDRQKVFTGEVINRRKNGEHYVAEVTVSPVLDHQGEVKYFLGIERDITKEKEVDQAKTEFLSLASHQLRTPLTTVSWYTEMLLKGDSGRLNGQQKEFLNEIYRSNRQMVELVNAFLNVSRLEMGTFLVNAKHHDLGDIASSVIQELGPELKKKKIKVIKEFDPAIPRLKLDENLTRIIFQNLLTNAIKYSPAGSDIRLTLTKQDDQVAIEVADQGMGIPLQQQNKVFTKLFRADNAIASDNQGSGLGLYIVKSILKKVGGSVSFQSPAGAGSTFIVRLPLSGMQPNSGTKVLIQ